MTNNKYKKTIAIVGAGLAGLSTGCYAQRNGDESHIFEHHRLPSGVVAAWKRKEYIFDGRVHFWTGTLSKGSKYSICEELGITRSHQFIPMDEYCLITDKASGVTVSISNDLDRLWNDMKGISSGDTEIIDLLAQAVHGMRDLFKYLRGRYVHSMADFARQAKDPWLRYVLENLFLPNVPVWFVAMLLAMLADVDLALLDEPSSDVPWAIAQRYTELGGRITYGGTVERIIVEDNKTLGI